MKSPEAKKKRSHFDMEVLIGTILLVGVLLSVLLLAIGLFWHWISTGKLEIEYIIKGKNLFEFLLLLAQQMFSGAFHPRFLVSLGIAVLLLTPLVRVFASMF